MLNENTRYDTHEVINDSIEIPEPSPVEEPPLPDSYEPIPGKP